MLASRRPGCRDHAGTLLEVWRKRVGPSTSVASAAGDRRAAPGGRGAGCSGAARYGGVDSRPPGSIWQAGGSGGTPGHVHEAEQLPDLKHLSLNDALLLGLLALLGIGMLAA